MLTNYSAFVNAKGFNFGADIISWLSDYQENEIGSNESLFLDEADFNASLTGLLRYNEHYC